MYLPMKMERTECSETSAFKLQTPGNYPKESIQHLEVSHFAILSSLLHVSLLYPNAFLSTLVSKRHSKSSVRSVGDQFQIYTKQQAKL
jgi:hypothetical protein